MHPIKINQLKIVIFILIGVKFILGGFSIWSKEFLEVFKTVTSVKIIPYIFLDLIYKLWLNLPISHSNEDTWLKGLYFSSKIDLYLLSFMLKIPFLLADFLCGILIYKIVAYMVNEKNGIIALFIWLINPYVTLITEMMGAIDVFPVLFVLLSVFYLLKKKNALSFLFLTIAISLKLYPIIIAPILLMFLTKPNKKDTFLLIVSSILGVTIYFHWIVNKLSMDFLSSLAFYTPFTFLPSDIMILFKYSHRVGLSIALGLTCLFLIHQYWLPKESKDLINALLSFSLIYFAFLDWFPRYLLLLLSLTTINAVINKLNLKYLFFISFIAFLIALITFNVNFAYHNSIFFIQNEKLGKQFYSLIEYIGYNIGVKFVIEPILRALFIIICVFYSIKLLIKGFSFKVKSI
ncbi:MAG: hypothetical protein QXE30_04030 [Candidatus Bathyarchaeia archaeon]